MRKTLLELLGIGRVMLLSHHHTCKGRDDLCKNHPRLQIGDFIYNHDALGLVAKAFNIYWPSLMMTKVSIYKWPLAFRM
jgi:hypothetical protein